MLLSISTITSPVDDFTLDLDSPDVDGDKLPRSPLHRTTDWSSKHLAGRIDGMEGEEFWFEGAEGWRNMGWIVKPRGWSERDAAEGKLWPMIFWMHGGPQGVFPDAWSTR